MARVNRQGDFAEQHPRRGLRGAKNIMAQELLVAEDANERARRVAGAMLTEARDLLRDAVQILSEEGCRLRKVDDVQQARLFENLVTAIDSVSGAGAHSTFSKVQEVLGMGQPAPKPVSKPVKLSQVERDVVSALCNLGLQEKGATVLVIYVATENPSLTEFEGLFKECMKRRGV